MSSERNIQECIDACRPGGEDLQLPELRELADRMHEPQWREVFQRSQSLDAAIGRAIRDVDVPPQLLDRLLQAIDGVPAASSSALPAVAEAAVGVADRVQDGRSGVNRRRVLRGAGRWGAALVAVAAALWLIVGSYPWSPTVRTRTADELAEAAFGWREQLRDDAWRPVDAATFATAPWPSAVYAQVVGCQTVSVEPKLPLVCYLAQGVRGGQAIPAVVFVAPRPLVDAADTGPPRVPRTTQGRCVGVWADQNHLYVLVVDGTQQDYRRLIRPAVEVI